MTDLPDIQPGTQWSETFAREWQQVMNVIRQIDGLTVAPPLTKGQAGTGLHIGFNPQAGFTSILRSRVALVSTIGQEATSLEIRRVRYATNPPTVGEYEWADQPTVAYPEVGFSLEDFAAFLWTEESPTPSTPFLDAWWDGYWFVSLPSQAEKRVVLRAFLNDDPGSAFVVVQEVRPVLDAQGAWTGEFEPFGDPATVNVWPKMVAGDYRPFLWPAEALSPRTTILPLTLYGGVWHLKQRQKRAVVRRTGPVKLLDCANVGP